MSPCESCGEELTTFCVKCHEEEDVDRRNAWADDRRAVLTLAARLRAAEEQRDKLREAAEPVLEFLDGCGLQAEEGRMREALRTAIAQTDEKGGA